ncbi:LexA family protein [Pseudomonas protegens]|uniref:LexA family protein n=1 Tax=Pseudomonas protegens TaxID=380021 RepID=UPI001B343DE9|nr:S24 family peptidase [Pseudomonas protegens]MBP5124005.1 peptidase S24 [Pseudomonas protegens]
MIDKYTPREKFSQRLHEALDNACIRKHGRGADILTKLRSHRIEKTPQAVSKWLNGGAVPEIDSLSVMAEWLGVRREWLEYGILPMKEGEKDATAGSSNTHNCPPNFGKVPLISWAQASAWYEALETSAAAEAELWLSCPVNISKSGYALRVIGDSMTNPGPGRSYPSGCVIFVDPEQAVNNGDRVIAQLPTTNEATFKVLVSDAGRQYLKPINPQYPIIEVTEKVHICGKVIGSFIPE